MFDNIYQLTLFRQLTHDENVQSCPSVVDFFSFQVHWNARVICDV